MNLGIGPGALERIKLLTSRMQHLNINDPITRSRLNNERNAWTPILRFLPEDVFIEIFFLLQITVDELDDRSLSTLFKGDLEVMFDEISSDTYGPWEWTTVTHVCRYWRQISLNCPKLWTKVNSGWHASVDRTRAYLTLSKSLNLSIRHFVPRDITPARSKTFSSCLIAVLKELPRIGDLCIDMGSKYKSSRIQNLLGQPAPKLRRLHLTWIDDIGDPVKYVQCLHTLFSGSAPQLRHLALNVKYFDWTSPLLKRLKTLNIQNIECPLSLESLFIILDNCSDMEDLDIGVCVIVDDPSSILRTVTLSKLQNLDLACINSEIYERLRKHLIIPEELLQWSIGINGLPSLDDHPIIPAPFHRTTACDYFFLFICPQSLELREHMPIDNTDKSDKCSSVRLMWEAFSSAKGIFAVAGGVIKDNFWRHATTIVINISNPVGWTTAVSPEDRCISPDCWSVLLRTLPNLEVLELELGIDPLKDASLIETMFFLNVLVALTATLANRRGDGSTYACPRLSKLKIKSYLILTREEAYAFPELRRCLDIREKAGIPIRYLEVANGYDIKEKVLRTMKKHGLVERVGD